MRANVRHIPEPVARSMPWLTQAVVADGDTVPVFVAEPLWLLMPTADGNITATARALRLPSRFALYRLMKKLAVE